MKFTDGQWLLREGVTAAYPSAAHEVDVTDQGLRVLAPTFPVRDRGDLLKGPVLTLDVGSPMTDVISVTLTHFAGEQPRPAGVRPRHRRARGDMRVDDEVATLTSGRLCARVHRREPDWRLELVGDGRLLTASGAKDMALMTHRRRGATHVREQLELGVGDTVYGLGERFGPLVRTARPSTSGTPTAARAASRPTRTSRSSSPTPATASSSTTPGRSPSRSARSWSQVQFSVAGAVDGYLVIYGPTPKEILRKYTALTGRPPLRRPGRSGCGCPRRSPLYDEETVTVVHRRHGRARHAAVGLPLRLLLDAGVPLVRLRVGPAGLPRPSNTCLTSVSLLLRGLSAWPAGSALPDEQEAR